MRYASCRVRDSARLVVISVDDFSLVSRDWGRRPLRLRRQAELASRAPGMHPERFFVDATVNLTRQLDRRRIRNHLLMHVEDPIQWEPRAKSFDSRLAEVLTGSPVRVASSLRLDRELLAGAPEVMCGLHGLHPVSSLLTEQRRTLTRCAAKQRYLACGCSSTSGHHPA